MVTWSCYFMYNADVNVVVIIIVVLAVSIVVGVVVVVVISMCWSSIVVEFVCMCL